MDFEKTGTRLTVHLRRDFNLLTARKVNKLAADADEIDTTLLVHPGALRDFDAYNQFLDAVDGLLFEGGHEGVYQVASFHPEYRFAGTGPDDPENYTNRSPYPMLHLLREASVARAVRDHPDVSQIPVRNVERMNELGAASLQALRRACLEGDEVPGG